MKKLASPSSGGNTASPHVSRHSDAFQLLEVVSPEFADAYDQLLQSSMTNGRLSPKARALVMVALTSTSTNLFAPSLKLHIRDALAESATREEIVEVFELVAALGLHSCTFGVPILCEEMAKAGMPVCIDEARSDEDVRLKDEFVRVRGYWGEFWDQVLALSPAFFKAYSRFSAVPWESGYIDPKIKEFIYIAIDSNVTHLFEQGLRVHVRNALRHGAVAGEIMEVLQLAATLGMQTIEVGLPLLEEEVARCGGMPS